MKATGTDGVGVSFVLDASVTVRWRLAHQPEPVADAALDRLQREEAIAPAIWWFEVRNALLVSERRHRLEPAQTQSFLEDLARLPIRIDFEPDEAAVLNLARQNRLTVYDAAYLELAVRLREPLATLDKELAAAANRAGVALLTDRSG